ncbi:hypothetical protein L249_5969, partial [Ophiocordyceps polyrhachis-furcata BCC 54312]
GVRGFRGASRGSPSYTPLSPGYACPGPGCARSSTARANSDEKPIDDNNNDYESGLGARGPYRGYGLGDPYNSDSNVIEVLAKR